MIALGAEMTLKLSALAFALAIAGCSGTANDHNNELATDVDCRGASPRDITLAIASGSGNQPAGEDVKVTGLAAQANDLTIRQVIVAGILADNDGFNYSTWSATVPNATLSSQKNDQGRVTLHVEAVDACRQTQAIDVDIQLVSP